MITTARWLTSVSGGALTIECHEMSLFTLPGDEPMLCASFSKIWPVGYLHDRMLGPRIDDVPQTQRKIVEKKRRARSAKVIADNQLIPQVRPST